LRESTCPRSATARLAAISSWVVGVTLSARFLTDGLSGRCVTASCLGEVGVVALKRVPFDDAPFEEAQGGEGKVDIAGGGR
jgi:hypothetical protein